MDSVVGDVVVVRPLSFPNSGNEKYTLVWSSKTGFRSKIDFWVSYEMIKKNGMPSSLHWFIRSTAWARLKYLGVSVFCDSSIDSGVFNWSGVI